MKEVGPVPVISSRRAATALVVLIKSTAEQEASKHYIFKNFKNYSYWDTRCNSERAKKTLAVYRTFQTKIGTVPQSIMNRTRNTKLGLSREKLSLSGFPSYNCSKKSHRLLT